MGFNADLDPAVYVNADPDPVIWRPKTVSKILHLIKNCNAYIFFEYFFGGSKCLIFFLWFIFAQLDLDQADPDPQHWLKNKTFLILSLKFFKIYHWNQSTAVWCRARQYSFAGTYTLFFTIQKLLLPSIGSQTFSNLSANLIHSRIHAIHSWLNLTAKSPLLSANSHPLSETRHPLSTKYLTHSRLHLIYFRLNLVQSRLNLIDTWANFIHFSVFRFRRDINLIKKRRDAYVTKFLNALGKRSDPMPIK
jgi:hypothetical protein